MQAEAFICLPSNRRHPNININNNINVNISILIPASTANSLGTKLGIGTGFVFFDDSGELLVSAQKPLGILLEEREPSHGNYNDRDDYTYSTSTNTRSGSALQDPDPDSNIDADTQYRHMGCRVSKVTAGGAADKAGVKEGDVLVAVQNADVANASFEKVMERIVDAPRVVNLRFWRKER